MRSIPSISLVFMLLFASFGMLSFAPAGPTHADSASPFQLAPATISRTLALGAQEELTLQVRNTGSTNEVARLYEAFPAAPQAARLNALPAALREVPLPRQLQRVDPRLQEELSAAQSGKFLVFLADRPDLSAAYAIDDWNQRGEYVYRTLTEHAERSQHDLRAWLDARGLSYQSLWIANAVAVQGTANDVQSLAQRADVALVRANYMAQIEAPSPAVMPQVSGCDAEGRCWNLEDIGAYRVWEDFGIDGSNIYVASIDSGVIYNHPALIEQYRGYNADGSIDHNYHWYDPIELSQLPIDSSGHGTHTMGTMAARGNDSDQPSVGVAPGARWFAARGCAISTCDDIDLILAAQWLLAPTDLRGQNPRPDLRPHVVNNSWAEIDGNNDWYAGYTAAWRAAGIFPVFAAGNGFSVTCGTIASPADYSDVVGVGATNQLGQIAAFSKRGPTIDGRVKPDLVAPGEQVPSTLRSSYGINSGTSMATPHVAGAVALLWSANPALIGDYDATYNILTRTARIQPDSRCGTRSVVDDNDHVLVINQVYGFGKLDAYAAVAQASVDVPWLRLSKPALTLSPDAAQAITVTIDAARVPGPGTYSARLLIHTGTLSDQPLVVPIALNVPADATHRLVSGRLMTAADAAGIAGTVTVHDGPMVNAAFDGRYSLILPQKSAEYAFRAGANGFQDLNRTLTVSSAITSTLDFVLTPATPSVDTDTQLRDFQLNIGEAAEVKLTLHNTGSSRLVYSVAETSQRYAVLRSDEPGGPVAEPFPVPDNATMLSLSGDRLSDPLSLGFRFPATFDIYETVFINANGWLTFDKSGVIEQFRAGCLPAGNANSIIAPLWADLNPAEGGTIRYASVEAGFLVDFNAVALAGDPTQRFSFQILLARDGRIIFNYLEMGEPGQLTSAGVQQMPTFSQSFGCSTSLLPDSPFRIELHPQSGQPTLLAQAEPVNGSLESGASTTLTFKMNWQHRTISETLHSTLLISSNDLQNPLLNVPLRLQSQPAPFNLWLPVIKIAGK